MQAIKSQTIEIYPKFWEKFTNSLSNLSEEMANYASNSLERQANKLSNEDKLNLEMILNLYIFIVEESQCIINSDCERFEQILQTMSIVSLWSIEFEKYLKNKLKLSAKKTNEIMTEILEFSSVESSVSYENLKTLLDEKTESQTAAYHNHIKYVKEKIKNLYLKLICY